VGNRGYVLFTDAEIDLGISYALSEYGIALSSETLRILANETREGMAKQECAFEDARHQVMQRHLKQRSPAEQDRYGAYKGALGKMFNRRKQFSIAAKPRPRKKRKLSMKVSTDPRTGQVEWIL
jgi:hypothetical protein